MSKIQQSVLDQYVPVYLKNIRQTDVSAPCGAIRLDLEPINTVFGYACGILGKASVVPMSNGTFVELPLHITQGLRCDIQWPLLSTLGRWFESVIREKFPQLCIEPLICYYAQSWTDCPAYPAYFEIRWTPKGVDATMEVAQSSLIGGIVQAFTNWHLF